MKQKYWDDLVIVYREFERMVKQKPANQQQERINTFLVNLKRIIALLQQDPAKVTSSNKNDLDRVEAHIHKQVLPILERLKNKTRAAATNGAPATAAAQQEQLKKTQEAQRLAQLQEQQKKMQEQQKAEAQRKLLEEQKKKMQLEAAAAAAKKQELLEQQRQQKQKQLQAQQALMQQQQQQRQQLLAQQQAQLKQNQMRMNAAAQPGASGAVTATSATLLAAGNGNGITSLGASLQTPIDVSTASTGDSSTANGMASLTPAQYRTFKLPESRKQQLTAQHAKLREQQQELIMQQSRAKTPSNQAKLAHQAQRLAQMINKISQQLVQCKLAEEYEQSKMGLTPPMSQPNATALNNTTTVKPETTTPAVNGAAPVVSAAVAPETPKVDTTTAMTTSTKVDESFKSVLPDMTGLGASEKLLTAVAAYEKHKPEVLKRGASRFSRIALTIGAKLKTSYVTS